MTWRGGVRSRHGDVGQCIHRAHIQYYTLHAIERTLDCKSALKNGGYMEYILDYKLAPNTELYGKVQGHPHWSQSKDYNLLATASERASCT